MTGEVPGQARYRKWLEGASCVKPGPEAPVQFKFEMEATQGPTFRGKGSQHETVPTGLCTHRKKQVENKQEVLYERHPARHHLDGS